MSDRSGQLADCVCQAVALTWHISPRLVDGLVWTTCHGNDLDLLDRSVHIYAFSARLRLGHTILLTCIAYICLVIPSALGVGLTLRPWNISCFNAHASTFNICNLLHYAPGSLPWRSQHSTCPPFWQPATTPVIPQGS
ncbi:hypothetical protein E2C01_066922 [Portunus trituberculatus]|uniref:Uncharacterized protein n=1 Tax=Portunus trituberculatus TaxID=210409 RepID=A0A5B7HJI1_PORTR|nr:hypothetical protein [Portunus trituberculatus]